MKFKVLIAVIILISFGSTLSFSLETKEMNNVETPVVKINIDPYTIVYEGDILNCTITGNPTLKYWFINNQSSHTTFYENDPVIFDPEPTPLDDKYVNLTVYAENAVGSDSDTVKIMIKRIYFGDIHWHSILSDGKYPLETMYKNAKKDNYLDFACSTEHAELWLSDFMYLYPIAWMRAKNLVKNHNIPRKFTTFLAYEFTGSKRIFKHFQIPFKGDTSHINFYYKELYPEASRYSEVIRRTYTKIFDSMNQEWDKGHYNIGFFHHPLAGNMSFNTLIDKSIISLNFYVSWTNFIKSLKEDNLRDNVLKIFRGVEVYSKWGTAIGKYSDIPVHWPYDEEFIVDKPDYWVENALWEWSNSIQTKGHCFVLQASSDSHFCDRPGSAILKEDEKAHPNPSGIMAAYAVHNTRDEIWDAMNNCNIYGTQLLKIRANVRVDGQMALGQWINCTSNATDPLKIRVSAMSTFPGEDTGNKNMCPHGYLSEELDYPIQDIWLIKKDRERGRPWCKVIGHAEPNKNLAIVTFEDADVQPNDFYYIAIRQKGQELRPRENEYMAFIGPVFINNIV